MITKEKLNEFLETKEEMDEYAVEIAEIVKKLPGMGFENIKYCEDDMEVCVTFSGHCRGYYEEEVYFPMDYLTKSIEEIKSIVDGEKKKKIMESLKEKEDEKILKEKKEKEELKRLLKKYKN